MKQAKTISLPQWMTEKSVKQIIHILNAGSSEPMALFVGGCVRNALLNAPATDIDIATRHAPDKVMNLCETHGIKTIPTGIDHGTVTAVVEGKPFEITTLRKDVSTDGRRATVAFTDIWEEDAQRRDFTLNALYADAGGNIYNPTSKGIADLEARRIRFVGEAETRIREDYLRILRFFRFFAWYGEGAMDEAALQACIKYAPQISSLSKERITQEIVRLIAAQKAPTVLKIIKDNNILPTLFHPEYKQNVLERYYSYKNSNTAAVLFVLSAMDTGHWATLETRLTLPNAVKREYETLDKIVILFNHDQHPGAGRDPDNSEEWIPASAGMPKENEVKKAVYYHGNAMTLQALQLLGCNDVQLLQLAENWQAPACPHTGEELIKAGHKPGPELGKKLKALEQEWLESL